jgi:MoaA/NifB/PqqE/SkfB family radical SAM enzyme
MALSSARTRRSHNARLNWREFWHGQTLLHSLPLHLQIGTNLTCNLRCIFCRRQVPAEQERLASLAPADRQMSWELAERIAPLIPYGEMVNLTPYGEPLLYSHLPELLERYKHYRSDNLALTTNAQLLDDERSKLLVQSGVHILFLSIDTCDPEIYAGMRMGGSLDEAEAGIERVNAWKDRLQSRVPHLILASTFMARNVPQLPAMVEFAAKHRIEEISVQLMEMENSALEPESLEHHIPVTRRMLSEAEQRARTCGVRLIVHLAIQNLLAVAGSESTIDSSAQLARTASLIGQKPLIELCRYPWMFLYIDTNGDVRPCCYASICFGNLLRQDFQSIWNGPQARQMRQNFLDNVIPEACRNKHCRVDL